MNAEYRDINPKYGQQYREHNSCRWLVFSNHDNALLLNDTDRRWRVVRHDGAPKSAGYYAKLYGLLADAEFVNAVGVWLGERDISNFNPGERPPMNVAKRIVVEASKTPIAANAEQLVALWPADVITNVDIVRVLTGDDNSKDHMNAGMTRALKELGATSAGNAFNAFDARGGRGRG